MIIISLAQAVELADQLDVDVGDTVSEIERLMDSLGEKLAARLGVAHHSSVIESEAFAGACVSFEAARPGQKCPDELQELDESGEL